MSHDCNDLLFFSFCLTNYTTFNYNSYYRRSKTLSSTFLYSVADALQTKMTKQINKEKLSVSFSVNTCRRTQ